MMEDKEINKALKLCFTTSKCFFVSEVKVAFSKFKWGANQTCWNASHDVCTHKHKHTPMRCCVGAHSHHSGTERLFSIEHVKSWTAENEQRRSNQPLTAVCFGLHHRAFLRATSHLTESDWDFPTAQRLHLIKHAASDRLIREHIHTGSFVWLHSHGFSH